MRNHAYSQAALPQTNYVPVGAEDPFAFSSIYPGAPQAKESDPNDSGGLFSLNGMMLGLVVAQVDWSVIRKKEQAKGWFPKFDGRYNALWLAGMVGYGLIRKAAK